jgi:hypothetical protein
MGCGSEEITIPTEEEADLEVDWSEIAIGHRIFV